MAAQETTTRREAFQAEREPDAIRQDGDGPGCIACGRQDSGLGIADNGRTAWFCEGCGADRARLALTDRFTSIELAALDDASNAAGEWIDTIGQTDIATWSPIEARGLVCTIVRAFIAGVRSHTDAELRKAVRP